MSVWKKIATPSSGHLDSTAAAADVNQSFHTGRLIGNSSETSGIDVTNEQPDSTCIATTGFGQQFVVL
jgi:hypothetical protein